MNEDVLLHVYSCDRCGEEDFFTRDKMINPFCPNCASEDTNHKGVYKFEEKDFSKTGFIFFK